VRQKAIDHHFECIDVMNETGVARPENLARRRHELPGPGRHARAAGSPAESLRRIYERIGPTQRLVLEYKFFEPAFYHTDVPDWGTPTRTWPRSAIAPVVPRHGPPRAGHEHRVHRCQLLRLGKLGSFDFNSRFYATTT
jgi:L-rhamnose isomerase/sugar isomerase